MRWVVRMYRRARGRCVVCGWKADGYWYCGLECAMYDGTLSMRRAGPEGDGWLREPSLFKGHTEFPRRRRENYN